MFYGNYRLIIFDFDGTLADSRELYRKQIFLNLKKYGYKISKKKFEKNFGLRLDRMLHALGIKKHSKQIRNAVNGYVLQHANQIKALPGINVVRELKRKKYKIALVSNSRRNFIVKAVRHFGIYKYFDYVLGGDYFASKVKAFKHLFHVLKIRPEQAVYIADRAGDIVVAKQAGCDMISISNKYSWSPRSEIKKATPDKIIKSLKELEKIL
ncbi:HAD family hydrolase [Candidatus Pacearchaeota archaeon]|nr:HAD family hydrolase [Candidatus Pacearchaeota archaeon]